MFTKQHYDAVANLFKPLSPANKWFFVSLFCTMFAEDNPNFDEDKFLNACAYGPEPTKPEEKINHARKDNAG